jgi:hypothetical protein
MGDWKGQGEKELVSFKHGLKRHLDVYDFENTLSIVSCRDDMTYSYFADVGTDQ